jgi:hypothetical protein
MSVASSPGVYAYKSLLPQFTLDPQGLAMKKFTAAFKKLVSPANALAILTVIGAVIVTFAIELEGLTPEKIIVILLGFIIGNMLFERIAVTEKTNETLETVSDAVQKIVSRSENAQNFVFFTNDTDATSMMRIISSKKPLEKVEILSSGLTSRQEIIPQWLNANIPVNALVQDIETALDKKDRDHIVSAVDWIHRQAADKFNLFEMRFHVNVATVRAVVLHEKQNQVKHVFISWYFYYNANKKVEGVSNPTIYCSTTSQQGFELYNWIDKVIQLNRKESRPINTLELIDD